MPTTPTGEPLPEYTDDDGHVSLAALLAFLRERVPKRWGQVSLRGGEEIFEPPAELRDGMRGHLDMYERIIVQDVLAALSAIGDATVLKNGTYRAMVRDRADLEKLAAYLTNHGHELLFLEHDGRAADAAIELIDDLSAAISALSMRDLPSGPAYDPQG